MTPGGRMRKSKFSETQIITILKAVEAGKTVRDVVANTKSATPPTTSGRQSTAAWKPLTFAACVSWRRKPTAQAYVRGTVFGASHLERGARKKAVRPAVKRQLIVGLREEHKLSERQACKIVSLPRSVYRYQPQPNRDEEIVKLLLELAQGRPE